MTDCETREERPLIWVISGPSSHRGRDENGSQMDLEYYWIDDLWTGHRQRQCQGKLCWQGTGLLLENLKKITDQAISSRTLLIRNRKLGGKKLETHVIVEELGMGVNRNRFYSEIQNIDTGSSNVLTAPPSNYPNSANVNWWAIVIS